MEIENLTENVVCVSLPPEPRLNKELTTFNEKIGQNWQSHVVVNFVDVEIVTSASISNLMILHGLLQRCGRRLVLCNVDLATKGVFVTVGLHSFFDFAEGPTSALEMLQQHGLVSS